MEYYLNNIKIFNCFSLGEHNIFKKLTLYVLVHNVKILYKNFAVRYLIIAFALLKSCVLLMNFSSILKTNFSKTTFKSTITFEPLSYIEIIHSVKNVDFDEKSAIYKCKFKLLAIFFSLTFIFCINAEGQPLSTKTNYMDSVQFGTLMDSAWNRRTGTREELLSYINKLKPYAIALPHCSHTPRLHYLTYVYYLNFNKFEVIDSTLEIALQSGRLYNYAIYTRAKVAKAMLQSMQGRYNLSMRTYRELGEEVNAKKVLSGQDSSTMFLVYNGLSICSGLQNRVKISIEYAQKSGDFRRDYYDSIRHLMALVKSHFGDGLHDENIPPVSLVDSAANFAQLHDDKDSYFIALLMKSLRLEKLHRYEEKLPIAFKTLKIAEALNNPLYKMYALDDIGNALTGLGRYNEALNYFRLSMPYRENSAYDSLEAIESWKSIAKCFEGLKQYDSANFYIKRYYNAEKSFFQKEKDNAYFENQALFETTEKEKRIAVEKAKYEAVKQEKTMLIGALILLTTLFAYAAYSYAKTRRLNKELQYKNTKIEMQSIELKNHNQQKDKLLTIIAHDMRSPINSYQGLASNVSFLLKNNRHEDLEKIADQIDRTGHHLSGMFDNLLKWGLEQQREGIVEAKQMDIIPFIAQLTSIYSAMALSKNIDFAIDTPPSAQINTDTNRLALILRNLLDNALKNTPTRGIIKFSTIPCEGGLYFTITNPCNEKCNEKLTIIHQLFTDQSDWHPGEKGMGLGLVMTQQFARKLKAQLSVKKIGEEICMELNLPNFINPNTIYEKTHNLSY